MKEKAKAVILSCVTKEQLESAQRYIMLFYDKEKDIDSLRELIDLYNIQIDTIKSV
jgi:hypothetical protein